MVSSKPTRRSLPIHSIQEGVRAIGGYATFLEDEA